MSKKVSVILPTYNMAHTLERAVDSALSQTYQNLELIIVDDGSKDKTYSTVKKILHQNKREIQYLYQENQGRSAALNKGIKHSTGDYITFLDADDTLTKDSIKTRLNYLESNQEKEAVFADTNYVDLKGNIYFIKKPSSFTEEKDLAIKFLSAPTIPFIPISLMYKKSVFDKVGYFDTKNRRTEDRDFSFRLLSKFNVGYLSHIVYNYTSDTHSIRTRLKNRLRGIKDETLMLKKHTKGLERLNLTTKAIMVSSLKMAYELFTYNKTGLGSFFYIKEALGKDGKLIRAYKIRTMYPGADKHLDSVLSNGVDNLGKPIGDTRITPGKEKLRRYWVDELPQLYNLLKGDLSLVGIRPRTDKEWSVYPEAHKTNALKYKPGLMGISYSHNNIKDFQQHTEIEAKYIKQKELSPFLTDLKYFSKIMHNIFVKGLRSR